MEDRSLTNFLLAIIIGVLLFGREAVISGAQGVLIGIAGIFAIYLVIATVGYILKSAYQTIKDVETTAGKFVQALVFLVGGIGAIVVFYAAILWADGDSRPIESAFDTKLGWSLKIILLGGIAATALFGLRLLFVWLIENRDKLPDYRSRSLRYLGIWLILPIYLPIREWRLARFEGSGYPGSAFSSFYALVIGLVLWSFLVPPFMLIGTGLAELVKFLRSFQ